MSWLLGAKPLSGKTWLTSLLTKVCSLEDHVKGVSLGGSFDSTLNRGLKLSHFINIPFAFEKDGKGIVFKKNGVWVPCDTANLDEALDSFSHVISDFDFTMIRRSFVSAQNASFVNAALCNVDMNGGSVRITNDGNFVFVLKREEGCLYKITFSACAYDYIATRRVRFDFPVAFVFEGDSYVVKKYTTPKTLEGEKNSVSSKFQHRAKEKVADFVVEIASELNSKLVDLNDKAFFENSENRSKYLSLKNDLFNTLIANSKAICEGEYDVCFKDKNYCKELKEGLSNKILPMLQSFATVVGFPQIDPNRTFESVDSAAYVDLKGEIKTVSRKPLDVMLDMSSLVVFESAASFIRGGSEGYGALGLSSEFINTLNKTTFSNSLLTYASTPDDPNDPLNRLSNSDGWLSGKISVGNKGAFLNPPLKVTSRWSDRKLEHVIISDDFQFDDYVVNFVIQPPSDVCDTLGLIIVRSEDCSPDGASAFIIKVSRDRFGRITSIRAQRNEDASIVFEENWENRVYNENLFLEEIFDSLPFRKLIETFIKLKFEKLGKSDEHRAYDFSEFED